MSSLEIAGITFACIFGGALLGMFCRTVLPEHHLSADSKDVVKVGMGLIATMAALVLGLLTGSAKSAFDTQDAELKLMAANVILLDRTLAHYGPDTESIRDQMRRAIQYKLAATGQRTAPPGGWTSRRPLPRWKASRTRSVPCRCRTTSSPRSSRERCRSPVT